VRQPSLRIFMLRKTLLTLTALASLTMAHTAKAVNDKTFFSGAHLWMTIDQCVVGYKTILHDHFRADYTGIDQNDEALEN
jgi:nucleoside-specific outer membrane channel protein Tsx